MLTLALESSCDETAVSILESERNIYKSEVFSQTLIHKKYGGVVPEIAARKHLEIFPYLIRKIFYKSKAKINSINLISVTGGPGLTSSILIGLMHAKTISSITRKDLIIINHLEGHILAPKITNKDLKFPYFLLLISGGHCQIIFVKKIKDYYVVAETKDDTVGELFDKIAKILNLGYPGGGTIEKYANYGEKEKLFLYKMKNEKIDRNFSFSGLKSHIIKSIYEKKFLDRKVILDICKSFQTIITKIMKRKILKILIMFNFKHKRNIQVVVSGGVASNKYIKMIILNHIKALGYVIYFPTKYLCTDNAVMIAYAGIKSFYNKRYSNLNFEVKKSWQI